MSERTVTLNFDIGNVGVVRSAAGEVEKLERSTNNLKSGLSGLGALISGAAVAGLARDLFNAQNQVLQMKRSLEVATGSSIGASIGYKQLRSDVNRLGLELQTAGPAFTSFMLATRGTRIEGEKSRQVFLSVSGAMTVLHASAEQQQRALLALQQMVSKGTVSAEELRQQLGEALPGAMSIGAAAVGKTTQEFGKLLNAGKLVSTEFVEKFAQELERRFAPALAAAAASPLANLNRLKNALFEIRAAAGEGLLEGVAQGFSDLNRDLSADEIKSAARELGKELGSALRLTGELLAAATKYTDEFRAGLILLFAIKASAWAYDLAQGLRAAIAGAGGLVTSLTATSTAQVASAQAVAAAAGRQAAAAAAVAEAELAAAAASAELTASLALQAQVAAGTGTALDLYAAEVGVAAGAATASGTVSDLYAAELAGVAQASAAAAEAQAVLARAEGGTSLAAQVAAQSQLELAAALDAEAVAARGAAAAQTGLLALGAVTVVVAAAAYGMQKYIEVQREEARVQQAELADSANVFNYLKSLREHKGKLSEAEYELSKAIRERMRVEEADATANALKTLYELNKAKRELAKAGTGGGRSGYDPDSMALKVAEISGASRRVEELQQAYEDAKARAQELGQQNAMVAKEVEKLGHETGNTANIQDNAGKRALESIQKQIAEMGRLRDERAAELRATLSAGVEEQRQREREAAILKAVLDAQEKLDSAKDKSGKSLGLKLDPRAREEIVALAGAIYDLGKANDSATNSIDLRRQAEDDARRSSAEVQDAINGNTAASEAAARASDVEAFAISGLLSLSDPLVVAYRKQLEARDATAASARLEIEAIEAERRSSIAERSAMAALVDAKNQSTVASAALSVQLEIEQRIRSSSVQLTFVEKIAIAAEVAGRRARLDVTKAETAAEARLVEVRRQQQAQAAARADWRQEQAAIQKYGSAIAGLLSQFGQLNTATLELQVHEQALAELRAESLDETTASGRERLAQLEKQIAGEQAEAQALDAILAKEALLAYILEPLADAWTALGQQAEDVFVDWATGGEISAKQIAQSLEREFLRAVVEMVKRWIAGQKLMQAEALKTASINAASANAAGAGGAGGSLGGIGAGGAGGAGAAGGGAAAGGTAAALGGTLAVFAAIYLGVSSWIRSHRKEWGVLTIGAGALGVTDTSGSKKSVGALAKLLEGFVDNVRSFAAAYGGEFKKLEQSLSVGSTGQGKNKSYYVALAGRIVQTFGNDAQAAMEFALIEAIKNSEISGLSPLVKEAIQKSVATTLDEFQKQLAVFTEIANLGVPQTILEVRAATQHFDELRRALIELNSATPATVGALKDLTLAEVDAWQAGRDAITGRQRTEAEDLAIRQRAAVAWNAEKQLRLANIALLIAETKAGILAYQARAGGGFINRGGGAGGGHGTNAGLGEPAGAGTSGLFAFSQAIVKTGIVAVQAANAMGGANDEMLAAMYARLAALQELYNSLQDLPDIQPGDVQPRGGRGGGGGSSVKDDRQSVRDFLKALDLKKLSAYGQALAELNKTFDEEVKLAHGDKKLLDELNKKRKEEIELLRQQVTKDLYGKIKDMEKNPFKQSGFSDAVDSIQEQSKDLQEEFLKTAHDMGWSAERIAKGLKRIQDAEETHLRFLSQQAFVDLAGQLADIVKDDKVRNELLRLQEITTFKLKMAQLRAEYELAKSLGKLTKEQEDALDAAFGWIDSHKDDLPGGANWVYGGGGGGGGGGSSVQELYAQRLLEEQQAAAQALQDAADRLRSAAEKLLDVNERLAGAQYNPATQQQQFGALYDRFQDLQARARTGDTEAMQQLAELEPLLLDLARSLGGTTNQIGSTGLTYQNLYALIIALNQELANRAGVPVGGINPTGGPGAGTGGGTGGSGGTGGGGTPGSGSGSGTNVAAVYSQQMNSLILAVGTLRRSVEGSGEATVNAITDMKREVVSAIRANP